MVGIMNRMRRAM